MISAKTGFPEVGTFTAVRFCARTFLLTANHVIENHNDAELTFVSRPPGTITRGLWWQRTTPGPLYRGQPLDIVRRHSDPTNDLAALEVCPSLEVTHCLRFFELHSGSKVIRPVKSSLLAIGLPFDTFEHLGPSAAAFSMSAIWGKIIRSSKNGPRGFNATKHLLMEFHPAQDNREPGGFSGAGVWYQVPSVNRPLIWHPDIILAGLITHYHRSLRALEICRVETLVKFLNSIA
jgi:hypothetical protein